MTANSTFSRVAALACMGALACQAQAQSAPPSSGVTLYGIADAGIYSRQFAGESRVARLDSGLLSTSRWGVRGTEDLGGNVAAIFDLTSHLRLDTGEPGRHPGDTAAGRFFTLASWVGLRGPVGTIKLGRIPTGTFAQSIQFTPLGDSAALSPLLIHGFVTSQPLQASHGGSDGMWNNSVAYITPTLGGLSVQVIIAPGEASTAGRRSEITITYREGPLAVALSHDKVDKAALVTPRTASDPAGAPYQVELERSTLGTVSYDFGAFKVFGAAGHTQLQPKGLPEITLDTIGLSAEVPVGNGRVIASWARTSREQSGISDRDRNTLAVGYTYGLSKRTDLYAIGISDRVTGLSSGMGYTLGVRHKF